MTLKISRFILFFLMTLMSVCESEKRAMESSLIERAKVMADLTAKVSVIRDDETEVTVAEC